MSNFSIVSLLICMSVTISACSGNNTSSTDGGSDTTPAGSPSDTAGSTGGAGSTGSGTADAGTGGPGESTSSGTSGGNATAGTNNPDAIGLSQRASLPTLNLPLDGVSQGDYQLVKAYPGLNFQEALFVDDVPGENRLVVVEQNGKIKVFNDDATATTSKVILDYSSRVATSSGEQGLLGLAFDPRFTENRFVYTHHTQVGSNKSIITRLPWDSASDTLDTSKEKIILQVDQPYLSHNGGMIAFGPDNFLYIALGDGGDGGDPQNNAQDRSTLLGSILRIDVKPQDDSVGYVVPDSNPFVGEAGVRPEIYAYGFRNPWRFSFDRQTGKMWLGDVGQENIEEIDIVTAGGNYGWRVFEGTLPNESNLNTLPDSAFTKPIYEYNHDVGLAVIGGYVYRGAVSSLQGRYVFTDFYNGIVTALSLNGETVTSADAIGTVTGPSSFGETRDGELLVVTRYDGLYKFVENASTIEFPAKLSQTGLFTDLASLTPASGLIEYTPSHPFWSDGTIKRRWVGVPDGSKIEFTANDWTFPLGSVSVKHFEIDLIQNAPSSRRRLETRVMYHTLQGWQGYTYRWNSEQTEATLLNDRQSEQLSISMNDGSTQVQQYDYPSRADCSACHTEAATFLLGLETGQLNANFNYPMATANQLRTLNHIGLFNYDIGSVDQYKVLPPLTDTSASIEQRARAYLDVNCSTCHQPQGSAPTGMDFRYEVANAGLNAIDVVPQSSSFGIADARIIAPGSKERSIAWHRMSITEGGRMPPISTHVVDQPALELIGQWIDSL